MMYDIQETKSALSSHIAKVTAAKPTMEAFGKALTESAFNV